MPRHTRASRAEQFIALERRLISPVRAGRKFSPEMVAGTAFATGSGAKKGSAWVRGGVIGGGW